MILLINLLLAVLTFFGVRYFMLECKAGVPLATIVALIMALAIFLANIAQQLA